METGSEWVQQLYASLERSRQLIRQLDEQLEVARSSAAGELHEENIEANFQVYSLAKALYASHKERITIADQLDIHSPLFVSGMLNVLDAAQRRELDKALNELTMEMEACNVRLVKNSCSAQHQHQILRDLTNPLFIELKQQQL